MPKPDSPKTILEFAAQLHHDDVCLPYLIQTRWPEGFVCPTCHHRGGWWVGTHRRFECAQCHTQVSPLAGTLLPRTHLPLHRWCWAAYLVATPTPGISAVQRQRPLGIAKNDTAWFLLHRLRQGMGNADRRPLSGLIEADETHVGGPAKGKNGRGVRAGTNKTLIGGAVETGIFTTKNGAVKKKAGRLSLQGLRAASEDEIGTFISATVAPGSTINSDGWTGDSATALAGYHPQREIHGSPQRGHELAPPIHQAFSNLTAWLRGIHHGVEPKYLQSYLNEFVVRFTRRVSPMSAFRSLLESLTAKQPLTLRTLTKP